MFLALGFNMFKFYNFIETHKHLPGQTLGLDNDLQFHVLFNSISIISGQWADDNERLCAMEPRLRLRRFRLERGSNPDR